FGVVAPVGGQGAHQRAVLALGAQVRVDLPQGALAGPFGAGAGELAGEGGADGDHVLLDLGGELTVLAHQVGGGGDDVHDVDVGEVVELASAGLPQRDHGPAHPLVALDGGAGDRGGRFERRIGEVAEGAGDPGLERRGVARTDVGRGDLRKPAVVGD